MDGWMNEMDGEKFRLSQELAMMNCKEPNTTRILQEHFEYQL